MLLCFEKKFEEISKILLKNLKGFKKILKVLEIFNKIIKYLRKFCIYCKLYS